MEQKPLKAFTIRSFNIILSGLILLSLSAFGVNRTPQMDHSVSFTENKGQITDQFLKPRKDILFSGNNGAMDFHIRKNGISYQQYKVTSWNKFKDPGTEKVKIGRAHV